jgi:ribosomal protein S18 acetylase RimI-like enzyme
MTAGTGNYRIVPFEERYRADVIALWHACGLTRPWNDPDKDIDRKLTDPVGRFLLLVKRQKLETGETDAVVGSVMVGYDGHRGSIYYLCTSPDCRREGIGKMLMDECEAFLTGLGCPKINLFVRADNEQATGFYGGIGYQAETTRLFGKRLIPDN